MKRVHSIPINDGRDHVVSKECWCHPFEQDVFELGGCKCGTTFTHNAMDCRERFERQGITNEHQKWMNVLDSDSVSD